MVTPAANKVQCINLTLIKSQRVNQQVVVVIFSFFIRRTFKVN